MEITESRDGDKLTLRLSGSLNAETAPSLEDYLRKKEGSFAAITFDLSAVDYVSSAGLRVFLLAENNHEGAVSIINASSDVQEVLDLTGFSALLGGE
jgi:anti-sigma B factor antagonist